MWTARKIQCSLAVHWHAGEVVKEFGLSRRSKRTVFGGVHLAFGNLV